MVVDLKSIVVCFHNQKADYWHVFLSCNRDHFSLLAKKYSIGYEQHGTYTKILKKRGCGFKNENVPTKALPTMQKLSTSEWKSKRWLSRRNRHTKHLCPKHLIRSERKRTTTKNISLKLNRKKSFKKSFV